MDPVTETVKQFILDEFLPGEDPANLTATVPLISSAVLDSLATLRLVSFLEQRFHIRIAPHEASVDHLNTLRDISALVTSRLPAPLPNG